MIRKVQVGLLMALLACGFSFESSAQAVFINEIHYDNAGTDVNEGFEIAGPAGTDLSCYDILLYNGSNNLLYATVNLSGTIDDEGCGYGAVWFNYAGLQNGAPDGIALYNNCTATVIQFLSYEGVITAGDGPASGLTSTNIGVVESNSTTLTTESLQLTGTGQTYPAFGWNAPAASSNGSINVGQNFCSCTLAASPTAESSSSSATIVGCNGATISWTSGDGSDRLVVMKAVTPVGGSPTDQTTYTANQSFGAGDIIAANEFVVYKGTGTSCTVYGLTAATTYHVAIFEFNGIACEENFLTGSPETAFFTTDLCTTCPHLTGALINACDGSCNEGDNEMVFLNSGDYVIPVETNPSWNLLYGSPNPPTTTYVDVTTTNAAAISDLDASAGCPGLFIDAGVVGAIPPNSVVIIVNDNICASSAFDFSPMCGSGPIYVVFSTDGSWIAGGNFANSTSCSGGIRRFRTDFTALGASCMIDYEYTCANNSGTDGDFVTYNSSGGAPTSYADDDCTIQPTVLPLDIVHLNASNPEKQNINVEADILIDPSTYEMTLEHAFETQDFTELTQVPILSNSNMFTFVYPHTGKPGTHYYRIKMLKNDGTTHFSNIASVVLQPQNSFTYSNATGFVLHLEDFEDILEVRFMDVTGRDIQTLYQADLKKEINFETTGLPSGIYLLKIARRSGFETLRVQF